MFLLKNYYIIYLKKAENEFPHITKENIMMKNTMTDMVYNRLKTTNERCLREDFEKAVNEALEQIAAEKKAEQEKKRAEEIAAAKAKVEEENKRKAIGTIAKAWQTLAPDADTDIIKKYLEYTYIDKRNAFEPEDYFNIFGKYWNW